MNIKEIITDSVKYPFLSIENILILWGFIFIGFFIGLTSFFINGYALRIIKSSLDGDTKPPKFNNWVRMLIDGIKVYVVSLGYSIPLFLILLIFIIITFSSVSTFSYTPSLISRLGVIGIVVISVILVYIILFSPIVAMALVYMEDTNEFDAAFRFHEIFDKIESLGWKNFIKWYLITIIPVFIIIICVTFLATIISNILQLPLEQLLVALVIAPLFIYICRSAVLFYMSSNLGYLVCEECGGYYELKPGESPEDFDKCDCGGKLKYTKSIPSTSESEDSVYDITENLGENLKTRSTSTNNKNRNLIIIGILALIIISIPVIYSTHALTQTPTNYKLLGSYNASNLNVNTINIIMPKGTKKIKIDYNLSWKFMEHGIHGFNLNIYSTEVYGNSFPGSQDVVGYDSFTLQNGQNKNGTYYFNNPEIKTVALFGNGIQGTIKIYTSQ